jgi:hypothetical protein
MTYEQFVFWLKGYLKDNPSPNLKVIQEQLDSTYPVYQYYPALPYTIAPQEQSPSENPPFQPTVWCGTKHEPSQLELAGH